MTAWADFREQYPQYNDIDDDALAEKLHAAHYSDMDFNEFRQKVGMPAKPEPFEMYRPGDPEFEAHVREAQSVPERVDAKLAAADDPLKPSLAEEEPGFVANIARGAGERAMGVVGELFGAAVKMTDKIGRGLELRAAQATTEAGSFERRLAEREAMERPNYFEFVANRLRNFDAGYVEQATTENIKKAYAEGGVLDAADDAIAFGLEQGLKSIPDMAATLYSLPAYVVARSHEMGTVRAQNEGREEATELDMLKASPAAIGSALLERFGAKGIAGAGSEVTEQMAETVGKELLQAGYRAMAEATKAGGKEAATEFFQEGVIEYLGETFGTDAQMSFADAMERGAWGALAGGVTGGALGGVAATGQEAARAVQGRRADAAGFDPEPPTLDSVVPGTAEKPDVQAGPPREMTMEDIFGPEDAEPSVEYFDSRLKREGFRDGITGMAGDLVPGGGVAVLRSDFNDAWIEGRTPSMNPDWFQRLADQEHIGMRQVLAAVNKAMTGEKLGERQKRIVEYMLDEIVDQRTHPFELDAAKRELEGQRDKRRIGREGGNTLEPPRDAYDYIDQYDYAAMKAPKAGEVNRKAHQAATSQTNTLPEPTEAQKEAGNYKKGEPFTLHGMRIVIENPAGSTRSGTAPDGSTWSNTMGAHYGDIKLTEGADGDAIDVFVGPTPEAETVYVIDQTDGAGGFDEHKAMAGFPSQEAAEQAYLSSYDEGWQLGKVSAVNVDAFKDWLRRGDTTKPFSESPQAAEPAQTARARAADMQRMSDTEMMAGTNYVAMVGKQGQLPISANHQYQLANGREVRIPMKPMRRGHIIKEIERQFGTKIYTGKVKGKSTLGFYRKGIGEVRTKAKNDLEVTAHEIAHFMDDRHPWIGNLYRQKKYSSELRGVSYDVKQINEGFAEFMRLYMTQEHEAIQAAPRFYGDFVTMAEAKGLLKKLAPIQERMHAWYLQGARARMASKIGPDLLSMRQRLQELRAELPDKIMQKFFDGLRPFKQAERSVEGTVGDATTSGYKGFRLAKGHAEVFRAVHEHGTIGWDAQGDIEFTGEGMRKIFEPVEDRMDDMQLYMVARRAEELMEQGRENLMRPDEIAAGLSIGNNDPEIELAFNQWLEFNKRMMDFYEQSGILGKQQRKAIEEMNKNYVPFNRIVESLDATSKGKQKVQRGGSPFNRLRGGTGNINDVFENIVGNTSHMIHMALTNRAKQNFYRMLQNGDNQTSARYAVRVPPESRVVNIDKGQVERAIVEGMGMTMQDFRFQQALGDPNVQPIEDALSGLSDFVQFYQVGMEPSGNIDFYFDDGRKVYYEVADPLLWDAIQQIGPKAHNLAVNILGGFANVLRRGVTLTPTFQIKNFIRDTMNAFTLSKGQMVPVAGALKGMAQRMAGSEAYWEFIANGGGFSSVAEAEGIGADRIIDAPGKLWRAYDRLIGTAEISNRLAEYTAARKKGYSKREAALLGREISTDFAMRGSSDALRVITLSVPFMNARMQGLYRIGREFGRLEPENRARFAGAQAFNYGMRSLIAITIPSLALYAMNKDDERYQEMPEWLKDLSWIVFTGDGEDDYLVIPKPFETGMMYGTVPERAMELLEKENGKEFTDAMLWMALETFAMDPTPQMVQPMLDLQRNKNFTGAPIIPAYLKDVAPEEQWRHYTSDAMIALGRKLGISPIKAEYLVRGYFGTLGAWTLGAADYMVGDINQGGEEPERGWEDNVLISPFVDRGPLKRTKSETDFYDLLKLTREVTNTVGLIEKRNPERLMMYLTDPERATLFGISDALEETGKALRDINNTMDQIRGNPDITGEEKTEQLDELQRSKNQLMRDVSGEINEQSVRQVAERMANAS